MQAFCGLVMLSGAILSAQQASVQQALEPGEVHVSSSAYVPQSPYTLRVETKSVEMNVVVRDAHGRVVPNLTKESFKVYDDGKEREITAFSINTDAASLSSASVPAPGASAGISSVSNQAPMAVDLHPPRFVALFFDDVNEKDGVHAGDLQRTQTAAKRFVADALKPGVRIGIFTASGAQTLNFTSDSSKLFESIEGLKAHPRLSENGLVPCPRISAYRAYRIFKDRDPMTMQAILTEAGEAKCPVSREYVIAMSEETWRLVREISENTLQAVGSVVTHLGAMPGNRMLLIASSGFFGETLEDQQERIVNQALRAGVVINALDSKGLYAELPPGTRPYDPHGMGVGIGASGWVRTENAAVGDRLQMLNEPLAELAESTGGAFFHNNNDLNAGFHQLGAAPEVTYHMSFRPDDVEQPGSYHKLKVKLARTGSYSISARPGYFVPAAQAPPVETMQSRLDREVAAADMRNDFPVNIAVQKGMSPSGDMTLSVVVHVDIAKLRFSKSNDRQTQEISFVTALFDSQGRMVSAKQGKMDLALTEATYARLAQSGINATLKLPVRPGSYKLREVVVDTADGKMACSTHPLTIQ